MSSESFTKYNLKYIPKPFGLRNIGSNCYLNSLLQSLLSCSSIAETLIKNKDDYFYKKNKMAQDYISVVETFQKDIDNTLRTLSESSIKILISMLKFVSKKKDREIFSGGQQCARESLYLLLDMMENLYDIHQLFTHRTESKLLCSKCNIWSDAIKDTQIIFDVQADLKIEQLDLFSKIDPNYNKSMDMNDFLNNHNGYVDDNHKCFSCKEKCEKYKTTQLVMIPEILVVLSKKYSPDGRKKINIMTEFPKELIFNGLPENESNKPEDAVKIKYEAVAQIEHSGSLNGGHYWAVCKRNDNEWYNINDENFTKSNFQPTSNTYIVFYHVM